MNETKAIAKEVEILDDKLSALSSFVYTCVIDLENYAVNVDKLGNKRSEITQYLINEARRYELLVKLILTPLKDLKKRVELLENFAVEYDVEKKK